MKESLHVIFWILGIAGIIASLLAAGFPAHVVVLRSNSKKWGIAMKLLAVCGVGGWSRLFVFAAERIGYHGEAAMSAAFFPWVAIMWLLFTAAVRGEELARLKGKIEDEHGRVIWSKR